jgi:hypothetical protein
MTREVANRVEGLEKLQQDAVSAKGSRHVLDRVKACLRLSRHSADKFNLPVN